MLRNSHNRLPEPQRQHTQTPSLPLLLLRPQQLSHVHLNPQPEQFATTEATAAAYADAVALAASSLESLPSQTYATASFAAHPIHAHLATVGLSEVLKDASSVDSSASEHCSWR
jgi:hypothetical protein